MIAIPSEGSSEESYDDLGEEISELSPDFFPHGMRLFRIQQTEGRIDHLAQIGEGYLHSPLHAGDRLVLYYVPDPKFASPDTCGCNTSAIRHIYRDAAGTTFSVVTESKHIYACVAREKIKDVWHRETRSGKIMKSIRTAILCVIPVSIIAGAGALVKFSIENKEADALLKEMDAAILATDELTHKIPEMSEDEIDKETNANCARMASLKRKFRDFSERSWFFSDFRLQEE